MANVEFTPEQLEAARTQVTHLVLGDQMEKHLGGLHGEEARDEYWSEAAQTHTPFAEKITSLRQALKVVTETQDAYGPQFRQIATLPFMQVEDMIAKMFL